ncbi:IS200/IS605 family transposase [Proteus terrae]|uniref:IS200/IS605 family transposase n=1 Tax=Proteus terrae TaxID=1574161 RepID=UPI001E4E9E82|nr:IS200/IS605 family transposase [Proteus terrae]
MGIKAQSSAHTKWLCKYHIVFLPKYRRKVIFNNIRLSIGEIFRDLCKYKAVEIIEGHLMPDYIHILVSIPPKIGISSFMGYLKGKSSLMIFDRHVHLKKQKVLGGRVLCQYSRGHETTIQKYIRKQEKSDLVSDKLSSKEYVDPLQRVSQSSKDT